MKLLDAAAICPDWKVEKVETSWLAYPPCYPGDPKEFFNAGSLRCRIRNLEADSVDCTAERLAVAEIENRNAAEKETTK